MGAGDDVQIPVLERGGDTGITSIDHGNPSGRVVEKISVQRLVTMFTKETNVSESRSNSLTSENESVRVENLRYKFESAPGRERGDGSDSGNIETIRSRFEEMTSQQASGREGITTARQLFEKSSPRDRAPNQIQMLDAMLEENITTKWMPLPAKASRICEQHLSPS